MGSFIGTFHIDDALLSFRLKRLKRLLASYVDEINLPTGKMDLSEVAEMQEYFNKAIEKYNEYKSQTTLF